VLVSRKCWGLTWPKRGVACTCGLREHRKSTETRLRHIDWRIGRKPHEKPAIALCRRSTNERLVDNTGQRESELHPPSDWKVVNESIVAWNSADQDMRAPCKLTVSLIRGFCAIHAGEEIVPEVQRQSEVRIPVLRNPRKGHRRKHPFIGIRWSSFSALSYLPLPEVVTVVSPFRDDQPHEPVMGECSAHPELVPCIEDRRG
jgi:hypothetical protein